MLYIVLFAIAFFIDSLKASGVLSVFLGNLILIFIAYIAFLNILIIKAKANYERNRGN